MTKLRATSPNTFSETGTAESILSSNTSLRNGSRLSNHEGDHPDGNFEVLHDPSCHNIVAWCGLRMQEKRDDDDGDDRLSNRTVNNQKGQVAPSYHITTANSLAVRKNR